MHFLARCAQSSSLAVAVPLSLIGTFMAMLALGFSINLLTLLAMVLAIGIVVDDAIIMLENIQRHIENGMSRMDASLLGARQLTGPVIVMSNDIGRCICTHWIYWWFNRYLVRRVSHSL